MHNLAGFARVRTFLFDVDGVMTDGRMLITDNGEFLRRMNTRDGFAMKLAIRTGYRIVVITGGSSPGVERRLRLLGIEDIYPGIQDKWRTYQQFLEESGVSAEVILYMGDDLPDYEVMQDVGLPACPRDADPAILGISTYISPLDGGAGCVRDVIEKTLRVQGKWPYP